jgi:hypothetical protein
VAVNPSHIWREATALPASWRATAMDTPWLTTETGVAKPPRELVVRTKTTEALHGRDAGVYCAEVGGELATSPAVRAIGLTTDPRVSDVVEQLAAIRADTDAVDAAEVAVRYAALAAAVANVDAALDSRIGELTVRQLRARFGADRRRPGLILVGGRWLKPARALRGKPILGRRRAFVPERSHADRLWRVLGVRTPTLSDCIAVLKEIAHTARAALRDADEQILLDTYVSTSTRTSARPHATNGARSASCRSGRVNDGSRSGSRGSSATGESWTWPSVDEPARVRQSAWLGVLLAVRQLVLVTAVGVDDEQLVDAAVELVEHELSAVGREFGL